MARRKDLSDWLIHFVHKRNPENDPLTRWEGGHNPRYPIAFRRTGKPLYTHWPENDESYPLAPDDSAMNVLKKIVSDGHIRAGWSFRGKKPTTYGPRAAVCFTEMPLYAFLDYAKTRADKLSVQTYSVALLKDELFRAGARPVIYGLSRPHAELPSAPRSSWAGPRLLDPSCGIARHEQYRFVAMNLGRDRVIDWSHEREWRWTKDFAKDRAPPGLAIWAEPESYLFSEIVLIVPTKGEATELLNQLQALADQPLNHLSFEMSRRAISRTKILALSQVAAKFRSDPSTRLEDLPTESLQAYSRPAASETTLRLVRRALKLANQAARQAAWERPSGGLFGFAWVKTDDTQSEVTQALIDLKYVRIAEGRGYEVTAVMKGVKSSFIETLRAATKAAAKVLTEELGQDFYAYSMLD